MVEDTISLKEHFEKILIEKDKALTAALASSKEAIAVADANTQKWRENANEWRQAMNDKDKLLTTKAEFTHLYEQVNQLNLWKETRAGVAADVATLKTAVEGLINWQATQKGKASQTSFLINMGITLILLAITIAKFINP